MKTKKYRIFVGAIALAVCGSVVVMAGLHGGEYAGTNASALSYSTTTDVSFTFAPTLSISLSDTDLVIDNMVPGQTSISNAITITVGSNTPYGYSLYADAGSNNTSSTYYNTSSLVHSDSTVNNVFASIATNASLTSLTTDNTWGYSTSTDNGTTWSAYNGLPTATSTSGSTSTDNPTLLIDTKDPADSSRSIDFKVAARASTTQASGTYSNIINFYAVGKPVPPPTDLTFTASGHIETLMVADSSNKYKPFYITPTSTSRSINFTAPAEGTKYIITVVPEAGYVLSSDSTNSSYEVAFHTGTLASNTLLTTTYTAGSAGDNITISASQAGSDSAYPAYTTMQSLTAAQCPAYTDSTQGINVTDSRDNKSYTVAKFGNYCYMLSNLRLDGGTELITATSHVSSSYTLPADTGSGGWTNDFCQPRMASINGEYYYNWPAATARANSTSGTSNCSSDRYNSVGDICPAGWSLPTYTDITPATLWDSGTNPGMLSTVGNFYSGSQYNVGNYGDWLSSTRNDSNYVWFLVFSGSSMWRSSAGYKNYGYSVRCMRSG